MNPGRSVRVLLALLCLFVSMPYSVMAQEGLPAATPVVGETDPQAAPAVQPMDISEFYVSVGLTMADGGHIPAGLTWSISGPNWTTLDSGPVTSGGTEFSTTSNVAIPNGSYGLWITGGGYSVGQTITVNGGDVNHDFVLTRSTVSVSFVVTTSNGADVPAGTSFSMVNADGVDLESSTIPANLPSGYTYGPETIERGVHTLTINAPGFMPFSTQVDLTNTWQSVFEIPIQLQELASAVTLSVNMSDGGSLPNGLEWALYPAGTWDAIAGGDVTAGPGPFQTTLPELVPYGSYQLWVSGNGYSSGQVLNIASETTVHNFTLTRLQGAVTVDLTTTDGRDLPAGTTWSISDGADGVVFSGSLDDVTTAPQLLIDGELLEFDTYTLTVSAPGFYPYTLDLPVTNSWLTEFSFTGEIEPITSTVSFTVSMADGGPLPYGLEWSLDGVDSGEVTPGIDTFTYTLDEPVDAGVYSLWVTGNGYSSGQVLNIQSATTHHDVVLSRITGTLTMSVETSHGGAIPVGTTWELTDAGDGVIAGGTIDSGDSNITLPVVDPIEFGVYTLTIGNAEGYYDYVGTINVTNPWVSDYTHTAELELILADVTISVSMSDGGPLPYGLGWVLLNGDDWSSPVQSGDVPQGETSFVLTLPEQVPAGTYQLWVSGNGYSSGQVIIIDGPELTHEFVFDRLFGNLTVTVDTSDDEEIPNGTVWSITDAGGNVIDGGELTAEIASINLLNSDGMMAFQLADGTVLPIANPIEFGVYTLAIDAEGYEPFSTELQITNPWLTEYPVTALLIAQPDPTVIPTETPAGTETPVATATATATATAPVVEDLPNTGQGADSGMQAAPVALIATAALAALAAGVGLAYRDRQHRA